MENLVVAVNAVVPFMFYIALGMTASRAGWVREGFLRELNGMIFKIFFPFIMFDNLYDVDFRTLSHAGYVAFAVTGTVAMIAIAFFTVPLFEKENRRRGVIIQALYRSNAVLFALPLTANVLGDEASAKASVMIAFLVPIYNISAVAILEYYRGGQMKADIIVKNILKNPLIMGAIAGAIFNMLPITMPECLVEPVSRIAGIATPMALFVLGGTLQISDLRNNAVPIFIGTMVKLVVTPALAIAAMSMLKFEPTELFPVFCVFATPIAAASFPMAQSMDADADLAGEYVVVTTLCSIVTIFLWILVMKQFGLI